MNLGGEVNTDIPANATLIRTLPRRKDVACPELGSGLGPKLNRGWIDITSLPLLHSTLV